MSIKLLHLVCLTQTPCILGRCAVVAGSAGHHTVDLASSTLPENNPSAHCSRDSASLHQSPEGICQ